MASRQLLALPVVDWLADSRAVDWLARDRRNLDLQPLAVPAYSLLGFAPPG
jgi:hypothetical protein